MTPSGTKIDQTDLTVFLQLFLPPSRSQVKYLEASSQGIVSIQEVLPKYTATACTQHPDECDLSGDQAGDESQMATNL